jgi:hypothetical protein
MSKALCYAHYAPEILILFFSKTFEPRHDKTNIVHLRPAWIQTSLCSLIRIHAVRLPTLLHVENLIANSMDPDQTAQILC